MPHLIHSFQNFVYHLLEDKASHGCICLHAPGGQYGLYVRIGTIDEEKRIRSAVLHHGDSAVTPYMT